MAKREKDTEKEKNLVDISSNDQVVKLYKKKGRAKRVVALVLSIILLLTGTALVGINLYIETHRKFEGNYEYMKDDSSGRANLSGSTVTLKNSELLQNSKVLNIMLFGEDNKGDMEHGRTDTMLMLSIDNAHKKLKLTSFQRDCYVYIPGHGYDKINASYTFGGATLSIKTIQANFGVKIDRYAVVDFDNFKSIIDTLGGVEMEVTVGRQSAHDHSKTGSYQAQRSGSPLVRQKPRSDHRRGRQRDRDQRKRLGQNRPSEKASHQNDKRHEGRGSQRDNRDRK